MPLVSPVSGPSIVALVDHRIVPEDAEEDAPDEVETFDGFNEPWVVDVASAAGNGSSENWSELETIASQDLDYLLDGLAEDILNAQP